MSFENKTSIALTIVTSGENSFIVFKDINLWERKIFFPMLFKWKFR